MDGKGGFIADFMVDDLNFPSDLQVTHSGNTLRKLKFSKYVFLFDRFYLLQGDRVATSSMLEIEVSSRHLYFDIVTKNRSISSLL